MPSEPAGFTGFPAAGFGFLRGLERDNSKAYFDAHRAEYRDGLFEPARAFVVSLGDELRSRVAPALVAEPSANGSLFRMNRDTRFSADKTPYKTNIGMLLWEGPSKKTSPCLYVGLDADGVTLGAGMYPFPDVERWRAAVADDALGAEWDTALAAAEQAPGAPLEVPDPDLVRVPRPYPQDHPRGRWLRYKALTLGRRTEPLPKAVHTPAFVSWAAERLEPFAGVFRFLVDHVA